eukprot:COSAG03_NODE_6421_length_1062_cov_6.708872_1_plen_72_part_00
MYQAVSHDGSIESTCGPRASTRANARKPNRDGIDAVSNRDGIDAASDRDGIDAVSNRDGIDAVSSALGGCY